MVGTHGAGGLCEAVCVEMRVAVCGNTSGLMQYDGTDSIYQAVKAAKCVARCRRMCCSVYCSMCCNVCCGMELMQCDGAGSKRQAVRPSRSNLGQT